MLPLLRTARSRRLGLAAALGALLALLGVVVVRSLPPAPSRAVTTATPKVTPFVQTYPRHVFTPQLPAVDTAHTGDTYALTWRPIAVGADPITGPTPVSCLLDFFGPYATIAEAAQVDQYITDAESASGTTGLTPAFAAPPLWLDALSGEQEQEEFTLPDGLASGYYVVVAQSGKGFDLAVGQTVVKILPPGA